LLRPGESSSSTTAPTLASLLPLSRSLTTTGSVLANAVERDGDADGLHLDYLVSVQALVEGPSVPRQQFAYRRFILTPLVLKSLPRGARSAKLRKVWEAAEVDKKWAESAWAKKREAVSKRRNTTDFERFEISLLKKQRSRAINSGALRERIFVGKRKEKN
jgi:large subunit ribosomal protein L14e